MMNENLTSTSVIDSPLGRLEIVVEDDQLVGIAFVSDSTPLKKPIDSLSRKATRQLDRYFRQSDARFDLPINLQGSAFQKQVWRALLAIEPGDTATYGKIAARLGSGARAVGNACRRNPVPIVVPCHRVVAAGHIGGYAGQLAGKIHDRKRWLLSHEGCLE